MKEFRVLAVSTNTNSFGLHQVVFVAEDGTTMLGLRTTQFAPKKHDSVKLKEPYEDALSAMSYECVEKIHTTAPQTAIDEVWNVEKHAARPA